MEECGRGSAVVQLTARGMLSIPAMGGNSNYDIFAKCKAEYQSPRWGAIEVRIADHIGKEISIPAMGGNSRCKANSRHGRCINPRDGGQ